MVRVVLLALSIMGNLGCNHAQKRNPTVVLMEVATIATLMRSVVLLMVD